MIIGYQHVKGKTLSHFFNLRGSIIRKQKKSHKFCTIHTGSRELYPNCKMVSFVIIFRFCRFPDALRVENDLHYDSAVQSFIQI